MLLKHILKLTSYLLLFGCAVSCQKAYLPRIGETIQLAASSENDVEVVIKLENGNGHEFLLSATFTPLTPGLHLYGKDIPKQGVAGLGRPTLLEIAGDSSIKTLGGLIESTLSYAPEYGPKELLEYPAGPITLTLPVRLPDGNKWVDDQVLVTYMACDQEGCRAPVEEKVIPIEIPGRDLIKP
jgi:hypothetical protein